MSWRLAGGLVTLRAETNTAYPGRLKESDGTIGDPAHQARISDHNPDAAGVVRAWDCTQWDPGTPDWLDDDVAQALTEHLIATRDGRVKYLIWRGRILSSYASGGVSPWTWRRYAGPNGHFRHCHISVRPGAAGDDPTAWGFTRPAQRTGVHTPGGFGPGSMGLGVEFLEAMLNIVAPLRINHLGRPGGAQIRTDGVYDAQTTEAVREFQRFCRAMEQAAGRKPTVVVDGIAGPITLGLLAFWVPIQLGTVA